MRYLCLPLVVVLAGCATPPDFSSRRSNMALSSVTAEIAGEFVAKQSGGYDSTSVACINREVARTPFGAGVIVDAGPRIVSVSYRGGRGEARVYYTSPRQSARLDLQPGGVYRIKGDYRADDVQLSIVDAAGGKTLVTFPRVPLTMGKIGFFGVQPAPCSDIRSEDVGPAALTPNQRTTLGLSSPGQAAVVFMNPGSEQRLSGDWFSVGDGRSFRVDPNKYYVLELPPGQHEIKSLQAALRSQPVTLSAGDVFFVLLKRQEFMGRPGLTIVGNAVAATPEIVREFFWDFLSAPAALSLLTEMLRVESADLVRR